MSIEDVLNKRVKQVGITAAELARRVGMNDALLRRTLDGKRPVKSVELLRLCSELELDFNDFAECTS